MLGIAEEAVGPVEIDEDQDAREAYRKAKKQGAGRRKEGAGPRRGGGTAIRDGQTLEGFNRRTGQRNRRYRRDSERHLAPKCPRMDTERGDRGPAPQERDKVRKPSCSSISLDTPVSAEKAEDLKSEQAASDCEQSVSTTEKKVWRCWMQGLRPLWCVVVGSIIIVFWKEMVPKGLPHTL